MHVLLPKGVLPRGKEKHAVQPNRSLEKTLPSSRSASHPSITSLWEVFVYSLAWSLLLETTCCLSRIIPPGHSCSAHLVPWAFSWEILGWFPFTWLTTTWHIVGTICWVSNKYLLRSIWSFPVILEQHLMMRLRRQLLRWFHWSLMTSFSNSWILRIQREYLFYRKWPNVLCLWHPECFSSLLRIGQGWYFVTKAMGATLIFF